MFKINLKFWNKHHDIIVINFTCLVGSQKKAGG